MTSIICITPVKNEAACLERFLRAASLWADRIIVADQGSTDGSVEICNKHSKVTVVENNDSTYDERHRSAILLDEARRTPGRRLLVSLDADELLSANVLREQEWRSAVEADPGTAFGMDWVQLLPSMTKCWVSDNQRYFAFLDDGSTHRQDRIHAERLPISGEVRKVRLDRIKVLHYQYTDWGHMKRKQIWYQCWERLHTKPFDPVALYRKYHHMDAIPARSVRNTEMAWFKNYMESGVDALRPHRGTTDSFDRDIVDWMCSNGPDRFRTLDIWDVDWTEVSRRFYVPNQPSIADPRRVIDKAVSLWLRRTQSWSKSIPIRALDHCLKVFYR